MFEVPLRSNKYSYYISPEAIRSCRMRSNNNSRAINCSFVIIHERIRKNFISHSLNLQTYVKDGYNCKTNVPSRIVVNKKERQVTSSSFLAKLFRSSKKREYPVGEKSVEEKEKTNVSLITRFLP